MDKQLKEMRVELLEKYKDVFKTKLGKKDRVDAPPIVIKIDKERWRVKSQGRLQCQYRFQLI